ncbi:hypothetical protein GLOTRDRAFT_131111 [Gloeophyllum trabeum ATCC 11539]|uniref:F-box domain-containing protein n=1 Tax=Gloeophyllum trabeum (strain ATCC 11539 / FP-39264 / Madison 617) TaxID=670483 RepID=S7RHK8_GLOTA|nr:uncharacterized protein GLOTRDRAFT_131111 [Gloeophyllum trabeum ATCC 11539]EPQ53780.1 hypothetical protein GLOTRDRAFT_131111 [Gloeophyllum trabeum ATCC 11539]
MDINTRIVPGRRPSILNDSKAYNIPHTYSTVFPHRQTVMVEFPVEIWEPIFSLACTDDGRTGCSLSLVSKFIHKVSAPLRYQSVLLEGITQMSSFLRVMKGNPESTPKVECLLLCDRSPDLCHVDKESCSDTPQALSQAWRAVLHELLPVVSHYLRTLTVFTHARRDFLLPDVSLPMLEELIIHGDCEDRVTHQTLGSPPIPLLPSLLRLHVEGRTHHPGFNGVADMLLSLSHSAPSLAHLTIWALMFSLAKSPDPSRFSWLTALKPYGDGSGRSWLTDLFPALRSVAFRPLPRRQDNDSRLVEEILRRILSRAELAVEVDVLKAGSLEEDLYQKVKRAWLRSPSG